MQTRPTILIGGGGHALVVAEAARRADIPLAAFLDDDQHAPLASGPDPLERRGPLEAFATCAGAPVHLAVGGLELRRRLIDAIEAADLQPAAIVDPSATVTPTAAFGRGVFVAAHALVQARARVGDWCIINSAAVVEHECVLGPNVHLAPAAVLAGRVRIGADTLIGLGARVLPGVSIGTRCIIGAGAVVTKDVPDGATVAGVPARPLR